jgi:SAM-dependent methyltransferase
MAKTGVNQLVAGASSSRRLASGLHRAAPVRSAFADYLAALPPDEYLDVHRLRYRQTMDWLEPLVHEGARVLELGPRSAVTNFLAAARGAVVDNIETDLRYPFDVEAGRYDLVVSMEVFEHLKDRDEDNRSYWGRTMLTWSGIQSCLSECHRVLAPGGRLFCTTPNPSSTLAIERILKHEPAMVYAPHVREITLPELRQRLTEAGFSVERLDTTWSWHQPADIRRIAAALAAIGATVRHRGDNTFCIAAKLDPA